MKLCWNDQEWNDLGRGKRPTHNATYRLLHMSKSYEELSKELAPFYREIEKGIRGCDKVSRTIELFEASDMKMSASMLGMTLGIFKTAECDSLCFQCDALHLKLDPSCHHFDGSRSPADWDRLVEAGSKDEKNSIQNTNTKTNKWRNLKEMKETAKKVAKLIEEGKTEEAKLLTYSTGIWKRPITNVPLWQHYLELIHLIEGVCKKTVKLVVADLPIGGFQEQALEKVFERSGCPLKKQEMTKLQLWQRLDKTKMNRVSWLQEELLRGK